jgi:hypothetical protein
LVDDGSTFACETTSMMSGAWPPPAPSVWKALIERPPIAASVDSRKPASLSVSVWIATWTPDASATRRHASIAAGVVPQSSCSLNPPAPARSCSHSASVLLVLPFPISSTLIGRWSIACSMRPIARGPGVTVVAFVPSAGPVPPPARVVRPAASATSASPGVMKWTWQSMPPAVRIRPFPAITSVDGPMTSASSTPSIVSGLPALPIPTIRPSRTPMSALTTPQWSRTTAPVITRSGAPSALVTAAWPIDSRITLPPPNSTSSPEAGPRLRSSVTSTSRLVSASRMRSPTVGPNRSM